MKIYNKYSSLWTSFTEGDEESFSDLYKLMYKDLFTYGSSLGIKEEDVRDIIQDLFVKLYTRPELIKSPISLQAYLYSSIRNTSVNLFLHEKKHDKLEQLEEFNIQFSVNEDFIESQEEKEQIHKTLNDILNRITPRQKEIIQLRFLHKLEYYQIANIMNLSEQAARNLLYRAFDKIRKESTTQTYIIILISLICSSPLTP